MNEEICVLTGVRPEIRARASAEAARLGLSLADYLADILLQISIVDAHAEVARDDCDQRWDSKFHLQDLRALRECMEERLAESAAHVAALAERLAQNERAQAVSSEQAHQLYAALAADLARETHTHHCALQAAREDFAGGVAELRDRQFEALARFEQLEAAVIGWASDLADVRDTVEMRL